MKIDRTSQIAGQPIRLVRDLLKYIDCMAVHSSCIATRLNIPEYVARQFAETMVEQGLLENDGGDRNYYKTTAAGLRLSNVRLIKRIDRAKANKIIADMLQRADEINANQDMIYHIAAIDAFGSYITDANDLGDIDLTVILDFKKEKGDIVDANTARAEASGRSGLNFLNILTFGRHEVLRHLKGRNPYISLMDVDGLDNVTFKRIYPRDKAVK
jgi:predicted transcriptional regulator